MAYFPSGDVIATSGQDKTIKLWDVRDGTLLRTLGPMADVPYSLAVSKYKDTIAVGLHNGTIELWSPHTAERIKSLIGHTGRVASLGFTQDGLTLYSAGQHAGVVGRSDKTVRQWCVISMRETGQLTGHDADINDIAISQNGSLLAAASNAGKVYLWNTTNPTQAKSMQGFAPRTSNDHDNAVSKLSFSIDQKLLAAGDHNGQILVWDTQSHLVKARHQEADYTKLLNVEFAPDSNVVVFAAEKIIIKEIGPFQRVFGLFSPTQNTILFKQAADVKLARFNPQGNYLAISSDSGIVFQPMREGKAPASIQNLSTWQASVALSPDASKLLSYNSTLNQLNVWDLQNGKPVWQVNSVASAGTIRFSPNGEFIVSAGYQGAVTVLNANSGKQLLQLDHDRGLALDTIVESIEFLEAGKLLITAGGSIASDKPKNLALHIWRMNDGAWVRSLTGHTGQISGVAVSHDEKVLASIDYAGELRLWDTNTWQQTARFKNPHGLTKLNFSKDNNSLFGEHFHIPYKIDLVDGVLQAMLNRDAKDRPLIQSLHVEPASGNLVLGDLSGNVYSIDAITASKTKNLSSAQWMQFKRVAHSDSVSSIHSDRTGRYIASISSDASLKLWSAKQTTLLATLYPFDPAGNLLVLPSGHYIASTPQIENKLLVRYGNQLRDVAPISAYREAFHRADIVVTTLNQGRSPSDVPTINSVRAAPFVQLNGTATSDFQEVELDISTQDQGGGTGVLRVFVNGSAVRQSALSLLPLNADGSRKFKLQLTPGANDIEAIVFNTDSTMSSKPASIKIHYTASQSIKPQLHALVIGINEFSNKEFNLEFAVADANAISRTLQERLRGTFETVQITTLTTPEQTSQKVILQTLAEFRNIRPQDAFVLYVASHGIVLGENIATKKFYVIPSNVASLNAKDIQRDALSQNQLQEALANIPASRKALFIDTCHAGALIDGLVPSTQGMNEEASLKVLASAMGSTVVTAASSHQEALEGHEKHGLFTWAFMKAMNAKGAGSDKKSLTSLDIALSIKKEVSQIAATIFKRDQTPIVMNAGQAFELIKITE